MKKYLIILAFICFLDANPSRIAISGGMWPLPSIIMMLDSGAKRLVYMPKASKSAILNSFLYDLYKDDIDKIKAGESQNLEELLSFKPDLFICHKADIKTCNAMEKSGVKTIKLSVNEHNYNSYLTLKSWLDALAPLLGKEELKDKILSSILHMQDYIAKNKSKDMPKALILHRLDSDRKMSAGGIFSSYLLEKSGAINVIKAKALQELSIEEVYRLNPDIIYITNFTSKMPQDLLDSPLWQPLKAIKNKRVFKLPLGSYRVAAPSIDLSVALLWLYAHNHPSSKEDFKSFSAKYYKEVFNLSLSKEQVDKIFSPSKNAGILK